MVGCVLSVGKWCKIFAGKLWKQFLNFHRIKVTFIEIYALMTSSATHSISLLPVLRCGSLGLSLDLPRQYQKREVSQTLKYDGNNA